jgi:hypothetical protein
MLSETRTCTDCGGFWRVTETVLVCVCLGYPGTSLLFSRTV